MSEEIIKNSDQLDFDEAMACKSSDEHLKAGSRDLSFDDLDSVAGGRGRK